MAAKIVLYIACSLDGFIAEPNGNLEWLMNWPNPTQTDHGYQNFLDGIGSTIMGRSTYDEVIGFNIPWPYKGINSYVFSQNKEFEIKSEDTFLICDNFLPFVLEQRQKAEKDIWLIGGGQLITWFLNHDLVEEMTISMVPIILGDGIPLFPNKPAGSKWELVQHKDYGTGIVNLFYRKATGK